MKSVRKGNAAADAAWAADKTADGAPTETVDTAAVGAARHRPAQRMAREQQQQGQAGQQEQQGPRPLMLLDRLRERLRYMHYSLRTEEAYVHWVRDFVRWSRGRHPRELGKDEVQQYLIMLANERRVAAATHRQALSALLFLYREVFGAEMPWLRELGSPVAKKRLPVVLTHVEVQALLQQMMATTAKKKTTNGDAGETGLLARLLYGTGMRLLEGIRLRVKDVDFERRELLVRSGKGGKDRVTVLPENLILPLQGQLAISKTRHDSDLEAGFGQVWLPDALTLKYRNAARSWGWQWVFPSTTRSLDPRSQVVRRHHLHEASVQKAVAGAARRAQLIKPCSPHVLRHSFATHLLQAGYDIRTVQELFFFIDLGTTLIDTHVRNRGGRGIRSPLDAI